MQHSAVMAIRSLLLLLAVLPLMLAPGVGSAQTFPAFTQTDTYSNVGWGVNTTRGWSFTVSSRIVVQQLGFWDSSQDGLADAHAVGIWRGNGTLLTSATVPAGTAAALDGTFRWVATTPVELLPGNVYVIGAYWISGSADTILEQGVNVVFDSRVSLVEGRAVNTIGLTYPSLVAAAELTANFKATGPNQPPVANAGPDRNAYTAQTIALSGSAFDADGDLIVFWAWAVVQAPDGATWELSGADTSSPQFAAFSPGDYVVSLFVGDSTGLFSGFDYSTVTVRDNLPPTAVMTADRTTVPVGGTVCFDGSQSSDPEGGPLRYIWDFADGSPYVFDQPQVCHTYSSLGTYNALLGVTDERDAFETDTIEITVTSTPPVPALSPLTLSTLLPELLVGVGLVAMRRRAGGA